MNVFKIACLQLNLKKTDNKDYVTQAIQQTCNRNPSIDLIVLSELAVGGPGALDTSHTLDRYIDFFANIANKENIWLIPGTFYEKIDGKTFNTAPVFNPNGELVTKARKIYPWLPYEEHVDSDMDFCVFEVPNQGIIGIHICYDLWFPETSRQLALNGAEVIINPTLTPTEDREIETIMVRATAAQQQAYYIDVNSCGDQGCGMSIASDPEGQILHQSKNTEDIFVVDVDFAFARKSRKEGFMSLGQNLKTYRDNPVHIDKKIDKEYLKMLGNVEKMNKD